MKVGLVGSGNMAAGLARGWKLAEGEANAPETMLFSDAAPDRAKALADELGGAAFDSNRDLASAADVVVLAVKPNVLDDVAPELIDAGTPVISILAGTPLDRLAGVLPGIDLVRVMPNLGAQLREAVLCVAYPDDLQEPFKETARGLLEPLGDVIEMDESLIDAGTALMGCTPGYLALLAEVMVAEGAKLGLTEDQSLRMVARSMAATGGLLDRQQPADLKRAVASPGGMTEAGLEALEEHGFPQALREAVQASVERARSLS